MTVFIPTPAESAEEHADKESVVWFHATLNPWFHTDGEPRISLRGSLYGARPRGISAGGIRQAFCA